MAEAHCPVLDEGGVGLLQARPIRTFRKPEPEEAVVEHLHSRAVPVLWWSQGGDHRRLQQITLTPPTTKHQRLGEAVGVLRQAARQIGRKSDVDQAPVSVQGVDPRYTCVAR